MSNADRDRWNRRYRDGAYAERTHPSALLEAWIDELPVGRALDVACGAGRNALYLAEHGFTVDAVDVSGEALRRGRDTARQRGLRVNWVEQDLDRPLALESRYQLILVIRFVNLTLLRELTDVLAPGGWLICEQHLVSDAEVIGPTNPAYRVSPGDLPAAAGDLDVVYLREGRVTEPDHRQVALAQLVARRQ